MKLTKDEAKAIAIKGITNAKTWGLPRTKKQKAK